MSLAAANYTKAFLAQPQSMVRPGEYGGNVVVSYDEYTTLAIIADAVTMRVGRIPKGARVLSCVVKTPDLGGTGTLNIGIAGTANGFFASLDASGQAVHSSSTGALVGSLFEAETDVIITFAGATATVGAKIQVIIQYILN